MASQPPRLGRTRRDELRSYLLFGPAGAAPVGGRRASVHLRRDGWNRKLRRIGAAIAVPVSVPPITALPRRLIEDDACDAGLNLAELLGCALQVTTAGLACRHYQQGRIHVSRQDNSVGDWQYRRAVDENQVE